MTNSKGLDAATSRTGILENMNLPWAELLHLGTRHVYPKKFPLALPGDAQLDFYYLARGRLRVMQGTVTGHERAMLYVNSGSVFNEASALAGFDDPDCRFFCLEESEVWRFSGKLLHDPAFVKKYPEMIINLMISMGTKLLIMHVGMSDKGDGTAQRQVCRYLLSLARSHGGSAEFVPGLSQEEIALFLGMHRATLVRVLRKLQNLGVLEYFTKFSARIGNISLLSAMAEDSQ